MTRLAIQRLFAQHCGGGGGNRSAGGDAGGGLQMDFAAFCTFCAAWEQRHRPSAVQYFFPLLDLRGCGYLTQAGAGSCWCVCAGWCMETRGHLPGTYSASAHLIAYLLCLPASLAAG